MDDVLVTKVRIRPEVKDDFADWQAKFHAAIVTFPGFLSLEILSPIEQGSHEWRFVERFFDAKGLRAWRESEKRHQIIDALRPFLLGESGIHEEPFGAFDPPGSVTEVFVTQVSQDKEEAFREWISKIHQVEAKFPGFRGVYVQSPSPGQGKNWITLLQFDTPKNLDHWLSSEERKGLIQESKHMIAELDTHRLISPYAGWFSSVSSGIVAPPVWKQTMIVLLVLFPLVMLEAKFLSPWTNSLNPSLAMFIGNMISVSLVSWPMVPIAIYGLGWWLTPPPDRGYAATIWGTLVVMLLYVIEILVFFD